MISFLKSRGKDHYYYLFETDHSFQFGYHQSDIENHIHSNGIKALQLSWSSLYMATESPTNPISMFQVANVQDCISLSNEYVGCIQMKNVFNNSPRKTNSLTQVCCSLVVMVAFASFLFGLFRTHLYSSSKPSIKKTIIPIYLWKLPYETTDREMGERDQGMS